MCTLVEAHDPTKPLLRSDSAAHCAERAEFSSACVPKNVIMD